MPSSTLRPQTARLLEGSTESERTRMHPPDRSLLLVPFFSFLRTRRRCCLVFRPLHVPYRPGAERFNAPRWHTTTRSAMCSRAHLPLHACAQPFAASCVRTKATPRASIGGRGGADGSGMQNRQRDVGAKWTADPRARSPTTDRAGWPSRRTSLPRRSPPPALQALAPRAPPHALGFSGFACRFDRGFMAKRNIAGDAPAAPFSSPLALV